MTTPSTSALGFFESACYVALGISFHVLATPVIAGVPIRVAMSDMVLGMAFLFLTARYFGRSKAALPGAPGQSYVWLGVMFALLVWAYWRVGIYGDSSAVWARIKVVGFVVLTAYFVIGSWIASSLGNRGALLVARGFVAGAWLSSLLGLVEYAAYFYFGYPTPWVGRIAALAENPNAYGIMLSAALALHLGSGEDDAIFSKRLSLAGVTVTLVAIVLSASRSAYVGLAAGLVGLTLFTNFRPRQVWRPAVAAAGLFVVLFVIPPSLTGISQIVFTGLTSNGPARSIDARKTNKRDTPTATAGKENFAVSRELVDIGIRVRLDLLQQALMMWRDRPLLGAGLGSFWRAQQARHVIFPYVNHNTALWLASEMGVVGLLVFLGGALMATVVFVRHANDAALVGGVGGMMFVMFGASIGMEVLYQRYAWCFCGLALSLVAQARLRRVPTAGA